MVTLGLDLHTLSHLLTPSSSHCRWEGLPHHTALARARFLMASPSKGRTVLFAAKTNTVYKAPLLSRIAALSSSRADCARHGHDTPDKREREREQTWMLVETPLFRSSLAEWLSRHRRTVRTTHVHRRCLTSTDAPEAEQPRTAIPPPTTDNTPAYIILTPTSLTQTHNLQEPKHRGTHSKKKGILPSSPP